MVYVSKRNKEEFIRKKKDFRLYIIPLLVSLHIVTKNCPEYHNGKIESNPMDHGNCDSVVKRDEYLGVEKNMEEVGLLW